MPAAPARAVPVARPVEPDAQPVPEGGRVAGQRAPGLAGAVRGAPAVHVVAHPGGEQVRPARRAAGRGRSATPLPGGRGGGHKTRLKTPHCCGHGDAILYIPSLNPFLSHFVTEIVTVPWSRRQNDGAPFPPALGRPPRGRAGHAASQRAGVADGIRVPELSRHVTPEKKETP